MSTYISSFSPWISDFFAFRRALGYSDQTYGKNMKAFDLYCAASYPEESHLTEEIVLGWLEDRCTDIYGKARCLRAFGTYLQAVGQDAYILPDKYITVRQNFSPYILSDAELSRLFDAVDKIKASKTEPFFNEIAPVMYRLIYTCGLRPREGRELKTENINFQTGELFITHTKRNKDRIVIIACSQMSSLGKIKNKQKVIGNLFL